MEQKSYRSISAARLWFVRLLVWMKGNTENTWQSLSHATLSTVIRVFTFICSCLLIFYLLQSVITATWQTYMTDCKDKTLSYQFKMCSEDPRQLPCLQGFSRPQGRLSQSRQRFLGSPVSNQTLLRAGSKASCATPTSGYSKQHLNVLFKHWF